MRTRASSIINVADYRELARRRLPKMIFDYLEGGAEDERGIEHNRSVLRNLHFRPRRLVNVSHRELTTELFGKSLPLPFLIGPTGLNGSFWPQGDLGLARAAAAAGIPFVLSTASNLSIEEIAKHCQGELWFQLYVVQRDLADQLVSRALAADYSTMVLTTDVTVDGHRERDLRNGFRMPLRFTPEVILDGVMHPRWSSKFLRSGMPNLANFASEGTSSLESQAALMKRQMDASFDFDGLARLRDLWPRKLLVKGIMNAGDAVRCCKIGVDGLILSNHGGRQLDDCLSPMEVLPTIVREVDVPVLVDSGFRRGSDIVKALALGARLVSLGRATLYGLAAAGQKGVEDVLRILKEEVDRTLALVGCSAVADLTADYLFLTAQPSGGGRLETDIPERPARR